MAALPPPSQQTMASSGGAGGAAQPQATPALELNLDTIADPAVRDIFGTTFSRIESLQNDIKGLQTLQTMYMTEGKAAFDKEDWQAVQDQIVTKQAKLKRYESKMLEQVKMYNSNILGLHKILQTRKEVLDRADDATKVLTNNPKLLDVLADKQLELERILEKTKQQLTSELYDSDDDGDYGHGRGSISGRGGDRGGVGGVGGGRGGGGGGRRGSANGLPWFEKDDVSDVETTVVVDRKTSLDRIAAGERSDEEPDGGRRSHKDRKERHRARKAERRRRREQAAFRDTGGPLPPAV